MKKLLKSAGDTQGTVSAEAAVASTGVILLFAIFITIAGYAVTAARVMVYVHDKAVDSSLAMYASGVKVPAVLFGKPSGEYGISGLRNLRVYGVTAEDRINVTAAYRYPSLFGDIEASVTSVCTLWKGDASFGIVENVWKLPPNERGREIEEIFGGNLPEFFPVIDCFDYTSGEAVAIVSIDTTLEVYSSGLGIKKVIMEKAAALAAFNGGKSGDAAIESFEIKSKKLLVVLPENELSDKQETCFEEALLDSAAMGLEVVARRFQKVGK